MVTRSNEPDELIEARELLKEFETSPGISKKSCFEEAIIILTDFLTEHPNSKFSDRVRNLKNTYIKALIKKLGATDFSKLEDWVVAFMWVGELMAVKFPEIEETRANDPELEKDWKKFLEPWIGEFAELAKKYNLFQ